ncbi:membrane protein [Streptomyces fumigatiscleroticus]|nr:membrane protein [Streptomyces fumigatiscleroticus]
MGSAQNSSTARKARIEEMRRAERTRERRGRVLMVTASAVVAAALVVGGVLVVRAQSDDSGGSGTTAAGDKGPGQFVTGEDGVRTWKGTLSRNHVTKTVTYPVEPPVGGDHDQVWMNCDGDVYTKALNNMNAVHSLEHGAVWVTYTGKAAKADVDALAAKVRKTPYTLMSPDDKQQDPIMLTAWGHQRTVTGASDPAVDAFFEKYVQGEQTPEPGAACTGGLSQ